MMRTRQTIAAAALAALGTAAAAEEVVVRSGEHGRFTRLAMVLDERSDWSFGRVDGGYELRFSRPEIDFETGEIYSRIARRRLANVSVNPTTNGLKLEVGCNCYANVFEDRPGLIVIDIREGAPPENSVFEQALLPDNAPLPRSRPAAVTGRQAGAFGPDSFELYWRGRPHVPEAVPADAPVAEPVEKPKGRVAEAQAHLLQQIARAAAQGLLEAAIDEPPAPLPAPIVEAPREEVVEAVADITSHMSLRAETSIDRELAGPAARLAEAIPTTCIPSRTLDITSWGDDRPMGQQLAEARAGVIGEFDAPDPSGVTGLAQLYLHFGFGAEARETLSSFDVPVPNTDILQAVSHIMDYQLPSPSSRLLQMTGCDTSASLWAVLAQPGALVAENTNEEAVTMAFSALPLHLRTHLGPRLSEKFLEAGADDTARMIRDAIHRAEVPAGPALTMLDAKIDLAQGEVEGADRQLQSAAADTGMTGAEAHALLMQTRLEHGPAVDDVMIDTAAALAFEHRDSPLGKSLNQAHILGLASIGKYEEAFTAFHRLGKDADIVDRLFSYLTDGALEQVFLTQIFANLDLIEGPLSPQVRQTMAERLLSFGFAEVAQRAVSKADPSTPADRLIMARASVRMMDPQAALRHLAGMEGPEAAAIRGSALDALGQHGAAAIAFAAAGAAEQEAASFWRAGDLAAAASATDEARRIAISPFAATPVPSTEDGEVIAGTGDVPLADVEDGMLSRSRALLEQSQVERQNLEALLATFAIPANTQE